LAKEAPQRVLTTLAHHIDRDFLREAYRRTRKDGAVGVDGQTAAEYEEHLESNLQSLLDRLKSGAYVAPPVRRAYVPKSEGKASRPIGIPTFEDKVLQRAVAMILEAVYEQDFVEASYGYRPGRLAHQALATLWGQLTQMDGGWVITIDIKSYFETMSHSHLRLFLNQRVRDGVIRRTIDKWLKAGVREDGKITFPDAGVPQGSGVAPILANVFLHVVFDQWFAQDVQPRLRGKAVFSRFADDIVVACACEADAQRLMAVLPKRFGKYGLTLHPEKTRVLCFRRPPYRLAGEQGQHPTDPETFDLLGFTHYWGRSRRGHWVIKRQTATGRLSRALKRINTWCRRSPCPSGVAASAACPEAAGPLCVLWDYGERSRAEALSVWRATAVAEVAQPAVATTRHALGPLCTPCGALSASQDPDRAYCVQSVAKLEY
jgi:group II intron reverse transcriptase/maturase